MLEVVPAVGCDSVCQHASHQQDIKANDLERLIEQPGWHYQIPVMCHNQRPTQKTAPRRNDRSFRQRSVDMDDVVLCDQVGRGPEQGGCNHAAAKTGHRLQPDHTHTVDHLIALEFGRVPHRQHGDLDASSYQPFGNLNCMSCQPGPVRRIISKYG